MGWTLKILEVKDLAFFYKANTTYPVQLMEIK